MGAQYGRGQEGRKGPQWKRRGQHHPLEPIPAQGGSVGAHDLRPQNGVGGDISVLDADVHMGMRFPPHPV